MLRLVYSEKAKRFYLKLLSKVKKTGKLFVALSEYMNFIKPKQMSFIFGFLVLLMATKDKKCLFAFLLWFNPRRQNSIIQVFIYNELFYMYVSTYLYRHHSIDVQLMQQTSSKKRADEFPLPVSDKAIQICQILTSCRQDVFLFKSLD